MTSTLPLSTCCRTHRFDEHVTIKVLTLYSTSTHLRAFLFVFRCDFPSWRGFFILLLLLPSCLPDKNSRPYRFVSHRLSMMLNVSLSWSRTNLPSPWSIVIFSHEDIDPLSYPDNETGDFLV